MHRVGGARSVQKGGPPAGRPRWGKRAGLGGAGTRPGGRQRKRLGKGVQSRLYPQRVGLWSGPGSALTSGAAPAFPRPPPPPTACFEIPVPAARLTYAAAPGWNPPGGAGRSRGRGGAAGPGGNRSRARGFFIFIIFWLFFHPHPPAFCLITPPREERLPYLGAPSPRYSQRPGNPAPLFAAGRVKAPGAGLV